MRSGGPALSGARLAMFGGLLRFWAGRGLLAAIVAVAAVNSVQAQTLPQEAPAKAVTQVKVDVVVNGIDDEEIRSNVIAFLGFAQAAEDRTLTDERALSLQKTAEKSALQALEPFGYYRAQVSSNWQGGAGAYRLGLSVTLGAPVRWVESADVVIEGAGEDLAFVEDLRADSRWREGRRLRHADYEAIKSALVTSARNDGYLDASLTRNVLKVDPEALSAQAQFTLRAGPRYYFGPTRFTGEFALREELLRRYLRYREGQPFAPNLLLESQFALADMDYFETVQADGDRSALAGGEKGGAVPVVVDLKARKNRRDSVGLGYGTDTGFRGSIGSDVRRLNRAGHKLSAELRASEEISSLRGTWRIPVGTVPGEFWSFTGEARQEQFDEDVGTEDYKLGASLERSLGRWKRRYYLEFTRSITDIGFSAAANAAGQRLEGETNVLVPGISLSTRVSDNPIHTQRGLSFFVDVHGAQEGLLSDVSFLQARTVVQWAYPLPLRLQLLSRGEYGATFVKGLASLPLEQRFYAGGDDSVRGYGYREFGERDVAGRNLGGKFVATGSVELERRITGPYGAAVFLDAGGAADNALPEPSYGVGLGFRYRAPFGFVRVDLAHPLSGDGTPVRLHLGVRVGL